MSTTQSPQDEIAAMQATLARHDEEIERINQKLPEVDGERRQAFEQMAAELAATNERIWQELAAVRDVQDDHGNEIANIKEMLAALVARTDAIVAEMNAISRTLTETNSRVGNIAGTRYERRVARIILRRPSRAIGLSSVQMLHTDWGETDANLLALLRDTDTISDDEYEDLLGSDIILVGQNPSGQNAYAVVEISITVSSADVNRATQRARTMARSTGDECSAIVVGSEIPDTERERAARAGAVVIAVTEPGD